MTKFHQNDIVDLHTACNYMTPSLKPKRFFDEEMMFPQRHISCPFNAYGLEVADDKVFRQLDSQSLDALELKCLEK